MLYSYDRRDPTTHHVLLLHGMLTPDYSVYKTLTSLVNLQMYFKDKTGPYLFRKSIQDLEAAQAVRASPHPASTAQESEPTAAAAAMPASPAAEPTEDSRVTPQKVPNTGGEDSVVAPELEEHTDNNGDDAGEGVAVGAEKSATYFP